MAISFCLLNHPYHNPPTEKRSCLHDSLISFFKCTTAKLHHILTPFFWERNVPLDGKVFAILDAWFDTLSFWPSVLFSHSGRQQLASISNNFSSCSINHFLVSLGSSFSRQVVWEYFLAPLNEFFKRSIPPIPPVAVLIPSTHVCRRNTVCISRYTWLDNEIHK